MCHGSCLSFATSINPDHVKGNRVLDVGSLDVNGTPRPAIEKMGCVEYIGVDMRPGKGVDVVCNATELVERFGEESFGFVISTEMMEHAKEWQSAISNMKRVCKPGGVILVTARSKGIPRHGYPGDYWRFEVEDMAKAFSDCEVLRLESDPEQPGVFIEVRKPEDFRENDLSEYKVFVMEDMKTDIRSHQKKGSTNMETQEAVIVLRRYAEGKMEGKKALKEALAAAKSFPRSHNRTVVMNSIGRRLAGEKTMTGVAELASLIGAASFVPDSTSSAALEAAAKAALEERAAFEAELDALSYSELQTMCKESGVEASGEKKDLIERLVATEDKPTDQE